MNVANATSDASKQTPVRRWGPSFAILSWFLPGLGHIALGQRRRGCILMAVILSLWLAGTLIGGIGVFDRTLRRENIVGYGQIFMAASIGMDMLVHAKIKSADETTIDNLDEAPFQPSLARVNEQGTLYTALAGLLNLLVMLDALYHDPRRSQRRGKKPVTVDLGTDENAGHDGKVGSARRVGNDHAARVNTSAGKGTTS